MKKIPYRMCIVTREKLPKKDLIRVVCYNEIVSIDLTGKKNGKGCYLKKDGSVIEQAQKRKILDSVFSIKVADTIYEELLKEI